MNLNNEVERIIKERGLKEFISKMPDEYKMTLIICDRKRRGHTYSMISNRTRMERTKVFRQYNKYCKC